MQTLISTLYTCLLLTFSWRAGAQPAPVAVPDAGERMNRAVCGIPLPPPPPPPAEGVIICSLKLNPGMLRPKDGKLKVDYSRKPGTGRVHSGEQIISAERVAETIDCHDVETYSAQLARGCLPPPPPPPPPPPRIICSDIFRVVEEMPRFPGCEELSAQAERKQCADAKLIEFIYNNVHYPAIAQKNGIEGTVVIQFMVEKDGSLTGARIVRDIGGQCGEEALRVVNLMNQQGMKWIPGKQMGRPVRVQMNIPVRFKLDEPAQFNTPAVEEVCTMTESPAVEAPANPVLKPPPPPPCGLGSYPPPPEEEIFKIVEEMPRFPGCEALPTTEEKKRCSEEELMQFIFQHLRFPAAACEGAVEGTVVVRFVVEKDGSVTGAELMRDIGAQCGQEALRLINLMNEQGLRWTPGRQRGRPVRVQYMLPIRFRLECPDPPSPVLSEEALSQPDQPEEKPEKAEEALSLTEATPSGTPLQPTPEGFRLFPNPATDWLNVHFQPAPGRVSLAIVNTLGQVLWKKEYKQTDGILEERIDLTPWPSGPYFLRIEQGGAVQTHSFIRQR